VDFDPVANPATLAAFRARFGVDSSTAIFGPFKGRLSDEGESIELYKPDAPSPSPDLGYVPWILVDRVNYGTTAPWSSAAAGGGASLQRRVEAEFGNDPLNWKAEPPTAGRANTLAGRLVPPVITDQPQDSTVVVGTSVTLSVTAVGSLPMAYRWQRDGADLPGATNATLAFSNAQPADSGSYQVWISNTVDLICSRVATLSVLAPPVITVQPFGLSATFGATVTLRVAALGSTPMVFQWYFKGAALPGATNDSITLNGVDPSQAGTYEAVVSNPAGVVASQPATLTVVGVDSDGDGVPDSWMAQKFGHPTGLASDRSQAQDDADGDGMSNLHEYLAGTDPLDPQSSLKLRVQSVDPETGRPQFSFTAVAGIDYTLQYSDNLGSGVWHKLNDVPADPTTRIVTLNDPDAASAPTRFYRVVTPIQP
jgi:Immunoglobulin domain